MTHELLTVALTLFVSLLGIRNLYEARALARAATRLAQVIENEDARRQRLDTLEREIADSNPQPQAHDRMPPNRISPDTGCREPCPPDAPTP